MGQRQQERERERKKKTHTQKRDREREREKKKEKKRGTALEESQETDKQVEGTCVRTHTSSLDIKT